METVNSQRNTAVNKGNTVKNKTNTPENKAVNIENIPHTLHTAGNKGKNTQKHSKYTDNKHTVKH